MFSSPESSFFTVLGFPIYYYGIILACAILVGVIISNKVAIKEYFLPGVVPDLATEVIIGGIIGARLYYCILNLGIYFSNPLEIFAIREGGLSIHGALIGGAIVLFYKAKKKNIEFLKLTDIISIGLPLAQAIGRWGNFFNSEAFGAPTSLPVKMFIREQFRPAEYSSFEYFHPTFLYESILNLIIFFVLYSVLLPKYKNNAGLITAWYLLLYSVVRIFTETLRIDCVKYVFNIPVPMLVSIVVIIFSTGFILYKTLFANSK